MEKNYKTNYAKMHKLNFEDYNGWCNRDTWLVMLWLNNHAENYKNIKRIVENTHKLKDLSDMQLNGLLKDFYYGDKIRFNWVDLDEIRTALIEE